MVVHSFFFFSSLFLCYLENKAAMLRKDHVAQHASSGNSHKQINKEKYKQLMHTQYF